MHSRFNQPHRAEKRDSYITEIQELDSWQFNAPEVETQTYRVRENSFCYTWLANKSSKYSNDSEGVRIPSEMIFRHSELLAFNGKSYLFVQDGQAYRFLKRWVEVL